MAWRAAPLSIIVVLLFLAVPAAACISPYGFEDFEPTPLVASGFAGNVPPVDVSASTVDDMFPLLVSYRGDLYAFWIKSTGTNVVTESLMTRVMSGDQWGPLLAVNSPDPTILTREGELIRVAGFDVAVHQGLLYVVWSTPDPEVTDGADDDPVYRTFDGETWGPIIQMVAPDDVGEDVQPSIASTDEGLLVAWTTNSPLLSDGSDQDIVVTMVGPDTADTITELTTPGDGDNDFLPEVIDTPLGTHVLWHTRVLRDVPSSRGVEMGVAINGRWRDISIWREHPDVTGAVSGEEVWIDLMWDEDRLCMVWQRGGADYGYSATSIIYREWDLGGFGPIQDLTARQGTSHNGRPRLFRTDGNVSVMWHSNDDGVTVGSTYDLVERTRGEDGRWTDVGPWMADPEKSLLQVHPVEHGDGVWAAWMTNVTYDVTSVNGTVQVWDVIVGPISVGADPANAITVTPRWVRSTKAWGPDDRIVFAVTRGDQPLADSPITVTVIDPEGGVEAVLQGSTGLSGEATFDHVLKDHGDYGLEVVVEDRSLGVMVLKVSPPPDGYMGTLTLSLGMVVAFAAALAVTGTAFIRRKGVVDPKAEAVEDMGFKPRSFVWTLASRGLTRVVKSASLQGWLQLPLFILFAASIVIGYLGTQDPEKNFTTMVGWVYYLPGMLILYAFFGRLWCYVEACGFMDTWAKRLAPNRSWRQWPYWLTGLWLAFILLLAGFWVEIVFSIDLYPWAVATFMLSILMINFFVSIIFGKRTYCRFVCRDGVVEELIARFSLFKVGVQTRADTTRRGGSCIWKEGEKRPGYCSMCFTCVQNNPDVQEASVRPMIDDYGVDVYRPKKVHTDEAWAALLLMGISIPYMMVLTRAWWVDLTDLAFGIEPSMGLLALLGLGSAMVVATALSDRWAFRKWPEWFSTSRKVLVMLLQGLLLSLYFVAVMGGGVGRLVALRSLIVLGCFLVPFMMVLLGERLVVRLTGDSRRETSGRLMDRYALIFIPLFIGVLIARNLPIVAMWGWAAWDVFVGALTNFPNGATEVTAQPFFDPSLFYSLGIAALVFGFALGAYTALQISRRLYTDRGDAMTAFGVHTGMLAVFVGVFVYILSMPPY
jgi:hypothetical protein